MTILDDILAGIAAALLIAFGVVLILNANLRADLAQARANASALSLANADLKDQMEKQNRAVTALKAASDARAKAAAKAMQVASAQAKRYAAEAAVLEKLSIAGDDCAAAKQILRGYLERKQ